MKINVLEPAVFNLLAAGEVVENPAAIIKELCENSIDAGATRLEVHIERGGLDMIRVIDNGHGVESTEVEKVFLPHATSKILDKHDLENIGTLGFRGEAMSSISAVSQVDFVTRASEKLGTHLRIEAGKVTSKKPVARDIGTTVTVKNLFYNTPARAKFLRPAYAEKNAVTSTIQRLIFANPTIEFRYIIDNEIIYDFHQKSLLGAIQAIYSDIDAGSLIKINAPASDGVVIHGFVGSPKLQKRNRTYQTVIVNGRAIDGGVIAAAVNNAFSNYMTPGNFPFFVLNLDINLGDVDVNVHPQKAQIKFSDTQKINDYVERSISQHLDAYLQKEHKVNYNPAADQNLLKNISYFSSPTVNTQSVNAADHFINKFATEMEKLSPEPKVKQQAIDTKAAAKFRIHGTVFSTYILIEDEKSLHILDQHAAHERLLYDKLLAQIDARKVDVQRLLDPAVIMLSPQEMTKFESARGTLDACGITAEPFGTNCFRITAVPVMVTQKGIKSLVDNILSDIRLASTKKLSELLKEKIISQCCRAAVKAGDNLHPNEVKKLIDDLLENRTQLTCPHGRPIIISYTRPQLEKLFSR